MACPTTWPNASPARSEWAGTGLAHKPTSSFIAQVPYIESPGMPPAVHTFARRCPAAKRRQGHGQFGGRGHRNGATRGAAAFQRGARQAAEGTDHSACGLQKPSAVRDLPAPANGPTHRNCASEGRRPPGSVDAEVFTPIERDVLWLTDALLENLKAPPEVLARVAGALSPAELVEVSPSSV
jgi:hypothetical protein